MEEKIIHSLQNTLPHIFLLMNSQRKTHLVINYDKEADVLYFAFDKIQSADDTEIYSDDVLIRKKNKKPIGITILNASSFLGKSTIH